MGKRGLGGALRPESSLRACVRPGIQALRSVDRDRLDEKTRVLFEDSVHLDEAFQSAAPKGPRWDYVLGEKVAARRLVAVEVHGATGKEVDLMIRKQRWAREVLALNLQAGVDVGRWFWIASGAIGLTVGTTEYKRMASAGLLLVGRTLLPKHMALRHPA